MRPVAQLLANPVVAQVRGVDDAVRLQLSEAMSYIIEGHEHMGAPGWDGRSTLYDWNTNKFPAGFQATAEAVLKAAGYDVQILKHPLPAPLGPMPTQENSLVDDFGPNPSYDYQFLAPLILERHGTMIARCATGAGKSRIAKLCIKRIGRKTLFMTTRQVLLYQMGEALEAAGFKVSYVGDGSWDTSGDVVLGMVQTLVDRLTEQPKGISMSMSPTQISQATDKWRARRDECVDFLQEIEFVIGEEAHEAGGNSYFTVLKNCRKAAYRLALTGTPMMRDGESNARLIAMFGPIRMEVTEEMLIQRGILARPIFKILDSEAPPTLRRGSAWQKAEQIGIVDNMWRNKRICAEAIRASRFGLSTMILVKRKVHGEILKNILAGAGMRVEYIYGDSNKTKRDKALKDMRDGKLDVLIGSTILDVGVDVPAIGMLILAGGGKAEVAIRQRIGRGLRAKKRGPNVCYVLDFRDKMNKHLAGHSAQRLEILKQTPGFAENILPKGKDFDFIGDGFVAANDNTRQAAAA
jgi:superfamily II DNA or RNA helicase